MTSAAPTLELKQVVGAMLFGSRRPVTAADMRRVLVEVAENHPAEARLFATVGEQDILAALEQIKVDLAERHIGVRLMEVAGGFRFQTDAACGPWLRHLLDIGKPSRLSRPTLETLAIIAYRQPVTRAEIEAVRGVSVDTIVRNLLELQLIRIVGRSPLPGRPLLHGTTQLFLEHFGLKSLQELPGIEQLCRRANEYKHSQQTAPAAATQPTESGERDSQDPIESPNASIDNSARPSVANDQAVDPETLDTITSAESAENAPVTQPEDAVKENHEHDLNNAP